MSSSKTGANTWPWIPSRIWLVIDPPDPDGSFDPSVMAWIWRSRQSERAETGSRRVLFTIAMPSASNSECSLWSTLPIPADLAIQGEQGSRARLTPHPIQNRHALCQKLQMWLPSDPPAPGGYGLDLAIQAERRSRARLAPCPIQNCHVFPVRNIPLIRTALLRGIRARRLFSRDGVAWCSSAARLSGIALHRNPRYYALTARARRGRTV